jgi:hypothetical protein
MTSRKSTPRADEAGPVAPEVLDAVTPVRAELAKTNVISETSSAFSLSSVAAAPVNVSVATVAELRVRTAVKPAGIFARVTSEAVSPAAHVAPLRVAIIEPVTVPLFAVLSVKPVPEYVIVASPKSTIKSDFVEPVILVAGALLNAAFAKMIPRLAISFALA